MPIDTEQMRAMAEHYRNRAYLLSGTQQTLAWFHENLLAALDRIEALEDQRGRLIAASGKQVNLSSTDPHV